MKIALLLLTIFLVPLPSQASAMDVLQTIHQALSYNPNLKSSLEARQEAMHTVTVAKAGYLPTIGIWTDYGVGFSDNMDSRNYNEEYNPLGSGNIGLLLSQNIWDGGTTKAAVKSSNASLDSANSMVNESAINIAFAALSVHIDVYLQRLLLELAENNVKEHLKTFRTVNERFKQGISTIGEVEQLRSRVARAKTTLLSYKIALNSATSNYSRIVGILPLPNLIIVKIPEHTFKTTDEIKILTIKHNPTIQKNIDNIAKLLSDKEYAQSTNKPKFSIEIGPSYFDTTSSRNESNASLNATLRLRWNLYSGGANSANIKASSARIRQARQELHQTMDLLSEDIETSFIQTFYAAEQAEQMAIAARSSKKSKDSFYQQFLAGQKGLLDVLDAESEGFSASVEKLSHQSTHIKGSYRLLALAGVLLNELDIDAEEIKKDSITVDSNTSTYGIEWSTLNPQPLKK